MEMGLFLRKEATGCVCKEEAASLLRKKGRKRFKVDGEIRV